MRNQIEWHLAMKSAETNEERATFWIREEPRMVSKLRHEFKLFSSTPEIREHTTTYKKSIVRFFLNIYAQMKSRTLTGCLKHIEACSARLQ